MVNKAASEGRLETHEFAFLFRSLGLSQVTQLGPRVFRGYKTDYGLVVVKLSRSQVGKVQLIHEAQFLGQHPSSYWPKILDSGGQNGLSWLMLEYLVGETLAAIPRARRFSWIKPLEHRLMQCHSTGHIHGDIKPSNILITPDQQLRLLDFGSVLPLGKPFDALTFGSISPSYSSPFMVRRIGNVEKSYDYFSLALTLSGPITRNDLDSLNMEKAPYFSALPSRYQCLVLNHLNTIRRLSTQGNIA